MGKSLKKISLIEQINVHHEMSINNKELQFSEIMPK